MKMHLSILTVVLFCGIQAAQAYSGCCAKHGGVSGCRCADGTKLSVTCIPHYPQCGQMHSSSESSHSRPVSTSNTVVLCQVRGDLPDASCTPGAVFANATKAIVCVSGYTKTVRNVSEATKNQVFAEYGITSHDGSTYEVDHLIPLEIGGSNDIKNLWPEAADPSPGFHDKDRLENALHSRVCSGAMPIQDAQQKIAADWMSLYQTIFHVPVH